MPTRTTTTSRTKAKTTRATATPPAPAEPAASAAAKVPTTSAPVTEAEMAALIDKAQHGDKKAYHAVMAGLAKVPQWEMHYPTPAEHARLCLLDAGLGGNLFVRDAWERRVKTLIADLAGADPSPLERLLCERVATCWLDTSLADLNYASRVKEGISFAAGEYYQQAKDRAHKRYLAACIALAKVRRLLAPVAQQVNIAHPGAAQVNVAQPGAAQVNAGASVQPSAPTMVDADHA